MNFFCDSKGVIFHVDSENVYQNSAGANVVYFIGAFPTNSQVTVAYKLPNGLYTLPQLMTRVIDGELNDIKDQYGKGFSVWKVALGESVKVDDEGNIIYGQDFTITENAGRVDIQFYVYGNAQRPVLLATAGSSFEVGKGVPIVLPDGVENDLLAQILATLQSILSDIDDLPNKVNANETNIERLGERVTVNEENILKNRNAISVLKEVQYQSGLQYIQPIESAYNERLTANGDNILDWENNGSNARLLRVEGDTKQSENLFDIQTIEFRTDNNGTISKTDTSFTFSSPNLAQQYFNGTATCLHLKPNTTYTSKCVMRLNVLDFTDYSYDAGSYACCLMFQNNSGYVTGDENRVKIVDGYKNDIWNQAGFYTLLTTFTTPSDLSGFNFITTRLGLNTSVTYSNLVIVEGIKTAEEMPSYSPYFEGLKDAKFQGILSRNAVNTNQSELLLPTVVDCGLGVTIDFENQNIVSKYKEITFDGSENWNMRTAVNGVNYFALTSQIYPANINLVGSAIMANFKQVENVYDTTNDFIFALYKMTGNPFLLEVKYSLATTVDEWKQYLANNPLTLRYITEEIQGETIFTEEQKAVGNEYTAWKDGTESVQGNSNALYGIYPTIRQEYVLVMDIEETVKDTVEEDITQALKGEY